MKKNYQAEEIGKLRAALAHREKSIEHYRGLVEKHSKSLHRQAKEIRRLRRLIPKDLCGCVGNETSACEIHEAIA